jgi:hypothetical protein
MTYETGYEGNFNPNLVATIANGQQVSSPIPCGGLSLCGITLPAAFTGTALTFLASVDGVTYSPVHSTTSGSALSYTVAQGQYCAIDPKDFYGVNFLQIKSGSSEGAIRTLAVSLKGF